MFGSRSRMMSDTRRLLMSDLPISPSNSRSARASTARMPAGPAATPRGRPPGLLRWTRGERARRDVARQELNHGEDDNRNGEQRQDTRSRLASESYEGSSTAPGTGHVDPLTGESGPLEGCEPRRTARTDIHCCALVIQITQPTPPPPYNPPTPPTNPKQQTLRGHNPEESPSDTRKFSAYGMLRSRWSLRMTSVCFCHPDRSLRAGHVHEIDVRDLDVRVEPGAARALGVDVVDKHRDDHPALFGQDLLRLLVQLGALGLVRLGVGLVQQGVEVGPEKWVSFWPTFCR